MEAQKKCHNRRHFISNELVAKIKTILGTEIHHFSRKFDLQPITIPNVQFHTYCIIFTVRGPPCKSYVPPLS